MIVIHPDGYYHLSSINYHLQLIKCFPFRPYGSNNMHGER